MAFVIDDAAVAVASEVSAEVVAESAEVSEGTIEVAETKGLDLDKLSTKTPSVSWTNSLVDKLPELNNGANNVVLDDVFVDKLPNLENSKVNLIEPQDVNLDCNEKIGEHIENKPKGILPSSYGEWTGERGNSTFIPDEDYVPANRNYSNLENRSMKDILGEFGENGVEFKDGYPDFSKFSEAEVKIENMTERRYGLGGNFDQADEQLSKMTGMSKDEIRQMCIDKNLVWHECQDCQTMQLISREVHSNIPHSGGVSVIKNR